jgi:cleavage and polyadenylation specificity factor subunit 2
MLRVTPIYGSRLDERGPSNTSRCTLIEYGGVSVLWNVGWTNSLPRLPEHQALILSDSTLGCMGGLPLYHQKFPTIPAFATFPTVKMGQMALYDQHASLCLDGTRPPFSLGELDCATASLHTIKYSQTITIPDPITGVPALSITAQRAGHVVGGAFFVLQRLQDETIVVLTSTYHIARELHLDSSTLLKYGATPDVLVAYPGGPAMAQLSQLYGGSSKPLIQQPVVSQAEKVLTETVLAVLRREGNCLLPVDASGRVLELLLLLSQHWDRHRLGGAYNLCWLGPMSNNTADFARSQLEWMAAPLGTQFDSQRGHPYALKNVSICSSLSELEAAIANGNPSCVLATGASLDCGMARDMLLKWADNQDHAVVFTDSSHCFLRTNFPDTGADIADEDLAGSRISQEEVSDLSTAGQLLSHWCQAKLEGKEMDDVVDVDVPVPHRAPLAGAELKTFLAHEEALRVARKDAAEKQAMLREVELAKGQLRLGEEEEKNKPKIAIPTRFLVSRPKKKSRFDSSLFIKFSKPLHST